MRFELQDGIAVLERTPGTLHEWLSGLPSDWLNYREAADAWSPLMVVGHLTHLEEVDWMDRVRRIVRGEGPFEPIDREAGFPRFTEWSVGALLERFANLRQDNLVELSAIVPSGPLTQEGVHPDFGVVTLEQLLATWVVHDCNHLGQIIKTMAKGYRKAIGPWRQYLPIVDAE